MHRGPARTTRQTGSRLLVIRFTRSTKGFLLFMPGRHTLANINKIRKQVFCSFHKRSILGRQKQSFSCGIKSTPKSKRCCKRCGWKQQKQTRFCSTRRLFHDSSSSVPTLLLVCALLVNSDGYFQYLTVSVSSGTTPCVSTVGVCLSPLR